MPARAGPIFWDVHDSLPRSEPSRRWVPRCIWYASDAKLAVLAPARSEDTYSGTQQARRVDHDRQLLMAKWSTQSFDQSTPRVHGVDLYSATMTEPVYGARTYTCTTRGRAQIAARRGSSTGSRLGRMGIGASGLRLARRARTRAARAAARAPESSSASRARAGRQKMDPMPGFRGFGVGRPADRRTSTRVTRR
jgi:hypothetical protein